MADVARESGMAASAGAGGGLPAAREGQRWRNAFAKTIESEIVPQLLKLTGGAQLDSAAANPGVIAAVADAAAAGEGEVVTAHVLSYTDQGYSYADALLYLVAPAARLLGTQWDEDSRDFFDVTVGLGTLHQVVSHLSGRFVSHVLPDRRILLTLTPGEQHTFGLAIVDHFFRAARWDVDFEAETDFASLKRFVSRRWYAVLGLSLSGDTLVEEAAEAVSILRKASLNPQMRVLAGGPAFENRRELAAYIGADAVAVDGRDAVQIADRWVTQGLVGSAQ
ncbi:MAG: cobalamin B12-binding domain-containing protein [Pseudomonadota bacterium]